MWPVLSGANSTSPRTELLVSKSCLVTAKWKVLTGSQKGASWPGEHYPNMTTQTEKNNIQKYSQDCKDGCLYNVDQDATEHDDLAAQQPDAFRDPLQPEA